MTVTKTPLQNAFFLFLFCFLLNDQRAAGQALPIIAPVQSQYQIVYQTGGANPAQITATIASSGASSNVNVIYTGYQPGGTAPWLTVIPGPGTSAGPTPATLTLICTPQSLPVGNYQAQILLGYSGTYDVNNSVNTITVELFVTGAGGGGGITPGQMVTTSPTSLAFSYSAGGSVPAAQPLAVTTSDGANFSAAVVTNDGNPWLKLSATSGNLTGID